MTTHNENTSTGSTKKRKPSSSSRSLNRRSGKLIQSVLDEYLLDHQSQNHSPQTLRWHRISLT
ncbi:MAG TPA: hypothetical protein VL461_15180, partial [Dictyobacter sp.]|nr:hypothetical protein [Dictyobacter sp.]